MSGTKYQYDDWDFTLLENLPTVHECILAIVHHAPTYGSTKQKEHLYQFSLCLLAHWQRAFGRDIKLTTIKGVKDKLDRYLREYNSKVQKGHGSKRSNLIQWKTKNHILFNMGKSVDVETFDANEKQFFFDQVALNRKVIIDNMHIDEEHESMVVETEEREEQEMAISVTEEEERVTIMNSTLDDSDTNINFAVQRSGRAFQELQTKMITTRQQLKFSDAQVETLKNQITHSKLLDQEISTLPEDTRTYEGVGRMFMLQPIPEVRKNLTKKIQTSDEKIKSINSNKTYLERSIKESEDNLRELILSKQSTPK